MNRKARRVQGKEVKPVKTAWQHDMTLPSASIGTSLDTLFKKAHAHYLAHAYEEAYQACLVILDRYPYQVDTLTLLGMIFSDKGEMAPAEAFFKESLSRGPANAQTLLCYANVLDSLGRLEEAILLYRQALALKPDHASTHYHLGLALQKAGSHIEALPHVRKVLIKSPEIEEFWLHYAVALRNVYPSLHPLLLKEDADMFPLVTKYICQAQVAENSLLQVGLTLTMHTAAFSRLLATCNDDASLAQAINAGLFTQALGIPLMEPLMTRYILPSALMEYVLTAVRRAMLFLTCENKLDKKVMSAHLRLMGALAQQCCLNEYVYSETPAETASIEALGRDLDAMMPGGELPLKACWNLLIYACYRSLNGLQGADWIEDFAQKGTIASLKEVAEKSITMPRLTLRLKDKIQTLGGDDNETSQRVGSMYEENPFPRWHSLAGRPCRTLRDTIRGALPSLPEEKLPTAYDAPEVLIAGCGTGRQALWSSYYTRTKVLAIDLSLSSLAYALHKTREHGIRNIDYMKADILNLAQLGRTFDVIECTGVLHHMQDPMSGWRTLTSLLNPGGMMKIALYSTRARQSIAAARVFIADKGYLPTPEGIRDCRQAIMSGALGEWTAEMLGRIDFFSLSECRDLLFHVMEHTYTLPQISKMLDELGLEFLGLNPKGQYIKIYEDMFPQDKAKMSIAHWDALEQKFPLAFSGMFQFWVKKA